MTTIHASVSSHSISLKIMSGNAPTRQTIPSQRAACASFTPSVSFDQKISPQEATVTIAGTSVKDAGSDGFIPWLASGSGIKDAEIICAGDILCKMFAHCNLWEALTRTTRPGFTSPIPLGSIDRRDRE